MRARGGARRREGGQAIVEFALVLPVLLLLVVGIMDMGTALHSFLTLANASREGARAAALRATNAMVVSAVQTAAAPLVEIDPAGSDVTKGRVTIDPDLETSRIQGSAVTVTVTYPMDRLFPTLRLLLGWALDGKTVLGRTVMRVE